MRIEGPIERPEIKKVAWLLRKMLGLKQIPKQDLPIPVTGYRPHGTLNGKPMPALAVHPMFVKGMAVYPLGIKDDPTQDYDWGEKEGNYNQEGL